MSCYCSCDLQCSYLSDSEEDSQYSDLNSEPDFAEDVDVGRDDFLLDAVDTDTSDEEEIRNTVGNIPLEWYDDFSHLGYDIEGKRIIKSSSAGDEVRHVSAVCFRSCMQ